eukprot:4025123-Amphidinium_carterae.1
MMFYLLGDISTEDEPLPVPNGPRHAYDLNMTSPGQPRGCSRFCNMDPEVDNPQHCEVERRMLTVRLEYEDRCNMTVRTSITVGEMHSAV